jgi:hypothetical protein
MSEYVNTPSGRKVTHRHPAALDELVADLHADGRSRDVPHPLSDHRIVFHLAQTTISWIAEAFGALKRQHGQIFDRCMYFFLISARRIYNKVMGDTGMTHGMLTAACTSTSPA